MITIGLISDTHGLVRPEVFDALAGVDLILHAGDVGPADVLVELSAIAPVRAVRGNTDAPGRTDLVDVIDEMFEQVRVVVTHGHTIVGLNPPRLVGAFPKADVIVYGHSHQQIIVRAARRIVVNPGAAVVGFFLWEMVKIALTVAMLFAAPRLVTDLSWPAMLVGLVVTMKVYWLALLVRPKK